MKWSAATRVLFRVIILAILVYTLLLSWWTPLTADSFQHSLFGAKHCFAFHPVLEQCWWSYLKWNPRLGEFLAFFVATAGKEFFLLINPFVLLSLVGMIFFLARGKNVNPENWRDVLLFSVGALLLFTSSSRPGVTMFWLSGSTNYAWAAAIWLGFLCLYRALWAGNSRIQDKPLSWVWIGAVGFVAGMTNENQIPASLGMLFLYWLYARCRSVALPRWFFVGWGFHALGGACLLLAPGNVERLRSETAGGSIVLRTWTERFGAIPELLNGFYEFMPLTKILLFVAVVALVLLTVKRGANIWRGESRSRLSVALLLILVAYAMAISFFVSVIPARHAMFSATVLMMTGTLGLFGVWMDATRWRWIPSCVLLVSACLTLVVCSRYLDAFYHIHLQCEERERIILHEVELGKKHIVVPPYEPVHVAPYVSIMWRMDSGDPNQFINRAAARYWGVESIRVAEPEP